jgi:hypothetical protein
MPLFTFHQSMVTIPAAMANSENFRVITSEQIRAARALLRWEQRDPAEASKVSLASVKRLETIHGQLAAQPRTIDALRGALEGAGIIFVAENGDGPGVRLRKGRK